MPPNRQPEIEAAELARERRFEHSLALWSVAVADQIDAEHDYIRAHAAASATAEGKDAATRAAAADVATLDARRKRDETRALEQAARWRVQYILARAGRATSP